MFIKYTNYRRLFSTVLLTLFTVGTQLATAAVSIEQNGNGNITTVNTTVEDSNSTAAAQQAGDANTAIIQQNNAVNSVAEQTQNGNSNWAFINQNNSSDYVAFQNQIGNSNSADINQNGSDEGYLYRNEAIQNQTGDLNSADINQNGGSGYSNGNEAIQNQTGNSNSASIDQSKIADGFGTDNNDAFQNQDCCSRDWKNCNHSRYPCNCLWARSDRTELLSLRCSTFWFHQFSFANVQGLAPATGGAPSTAR